MRYMYIAAAFLVGFIPLKAAEFNPDVVAQELSQEYKDRFFLDNQGGDGAFKFKSETVGGRIVWIFHPPKSQYKVDGLEIKNTRFDNLGGGDSVFYLQIEDTPYKVHLSNDAACIKFRGDANGAHIALIKAWVATFKGQVISVTLTAHTE